MFFCFLDICTVHFRKNHLVYQILLIHSLKYIHYGFSKTTERITIKLVIHSLFLWRTCSLRNDKKPLCRDQDLVYTRQLFVILLYFASTTANYTTALTFNDIKPTTVSLVQPGRRLGVDTEADILQGEGEVATNSICWRHKL